MTRPRIPDTPGTFMIHVPKDSHQGMIALMTGVFLVTTRKPATTSTVASRDLARNDLRIAPQ